jgi:DNA-binding response OmpR family regulator
MIDILIVEDNKEIGTLLCDFLKEDGYTVFLAVSGEEALEYINKHTIRLVVLDIMLPGIDGFTVCRKIREENNTPIIIVSAKVEKEDKMNGLVLGADDYMMVDGNLKIDKIRRIACFKDSELTLTSKEFELLLLLAENKGKALKKDWIFNKVWGFDSFSEQQTLTVHIQWLRQKIEEDPKNPLRIKTVWGVGYRFE